MTTLKANLRHVMKEGDGEGKFLKVKTIRKL